LQFLAPTFGNLFAIPGLVCDPELVGGGWHCIPRGGFLKTHVDFNHLNGYTRRLNLLLYLSPGWDRSWGGELRLCDRVIEPLFNRCVVFETSEKSWHGHPEPLTCPEGESRNSIALYYYTKGAEGASHCTVYR